MQSKITTKFQSVRWHWCDVMIAHLIFYFFFFKTFSSFLTIYFIVHSFLSNKQKYCRSKSFLIFDAIKMLFMSFKNDGVPMIWVQKSASHYVNPPVENDGFVDSRIWDSRILGLFRRYIYRWHNNT